MIVGATHPTSIRHKDDGVDGHDILAAQLDFHQSMGSGCSFAKHAAEDPVKHGWRHMCFSETISGKTLKAIDAFVAESISDVAVSTISLILPQVTTEPVLKELLLWLEKTESFYYEPDIIVGGFRCVRLRARMGNSAAWVSGFAPLTFLPKTRQAPHTELVFRVKARPPYAKSIQPEPPVGTLHVADMEMPGMGKAEFTRRWQESFRLTKSILGHNANELSSAKVTFILPLVTSSGTAFNT